MRIYVDVPRWFISPRNTDWRVSFDVAEMAARWPDSTVRVSRCVKTVLAINGGYLFHALAHRFGVGRLARRVQSHPLVRGHGLCSGELRRFRPDVVFAHGICPTNLAAVPLLWLTGFATETDVRAEGIGDAEFARGRARFRRLAERAAIVAVSNDDAASRLVSEMPAIGARVRVLPFYRPYIRPAERRRVVEKQRGGGPLRVLFVGSQARKKGLPVLLAAMASLQRSRPGAFHLEVVSGMTDGPVGVPPSVPATLLGPLPSPATQERFAEAQVFVMPSASDSYGIVFVEAMAQGCVVLAPDKDPQRGILDGGRAGVLVDPRSPAAIANALAALADDRGRRESIALAGHERYLREYHHESVERRFRSAFDDAIRFGAPPRSPP